MKKVCINIAKWYLRLLIVGFLGYCWYFNIQHFILKDDWYGQDGFFFFIFMIGGGINFMFLLLVGGILLIGVGGILKWIFGTNKKEEDVSAL